MTLSSNSPFWNRLAAGANLPVVVASTKTNKNLLLYAEQLAYEDSLERQVNTKKIHYLNISPSKEGAGFFLFVVFEGKVQSFNGMFVVGPTNDTFTIKYPTFECAEVYLEKHDYFGLKNTKFCDGIFASWDKQ